MTEQPENLDNLAVPDVDLDNDGTPDDPEHLAVEAAAQERDDDPDGDPDALDPGDLYEAPSDTDPPAADQVHPDAGAPLDDLDEDQDDGVEDYSEVEDDDPDPDPEPEPDEVEAEATTDDPTP